MAETLQIEIQDRSSSAGSGSGPPRAPSAGGGGASGPGAGGGTGGGAKLTPGKKDQDPLAEVWNQLGVGRFMGAVRTLTHGQPKPPTAPGAGAASKAPPKPPTAAAGGGAVAKPPGLGGAGGVGGAAGAAGGEAGAAAAGMEAMGGLAAAAGPIGAALVIADIAADQMAKGFDSTREKIEHFGKQVGLAAGNDYLGMFKAGLDAVHHPLADIPIVGKVFESQMQAAIAPIKAFTGVVEAFNHRASELAGFSPDIAMAQARGNIQSVMDDFQEAQSLGPALASMMDSENAIQHDLREMLLPIKQFILEHLASFLKLVADGFGELRAIGEAVKAGIAKLELAIDDFQRGNMDNMKVTLFSLLNVAKGAYDLAKQNSNKKVDTDFWLRELYAAEVAESPRQDRGGDSRLNIPVVNEMAGL